jgi:diguanylate cyclase (GGDEF)-like protein
MKMESKKHKWNRVIVLIAYSLIVVLLPLMFSKNISSDFKNHMEEQRQNSVSRMVHLAYNAVNPIIKELKNGEITHEEAKGKIVNYVKDMTYYDEFGLNYIFMSSYDGTMLVQPYERDKVETNQWLLKDANERYIIQALVNAAKEKPEGSFVTYAYYLPNQSFIEEKLSYVIGIPEINAYIGTGMYIESPYRMLEAILNKQSIGYLSMTIFILISLLLYASLLRNSNKRLQNEMQKRKMDMEKIHNLAYFDSLTGLPNRIYALNELQEKINKCDTHPCVGNIFFIDIDNFKFINDTHGHSFGDKMLIEIAKRLNELASSNLMLSRLGGDEFLILYCNTEGTADAIELADKVLSVFKEAIIIDDISFYITCSIGIAVYPIDGNTVEELLKHADLAAYTAKTSGKNKYVLFDKNMLEAFEERANLEERLKDAYKNNEFILYYQPQIDTKSEKIVGLEALLRWNSSSHGLVMPRSFITVAEEIGLINEIGKWVIESSFAFAKELMHKNICISCNVSAVQLKQSSFANDVIEVFNRYGLKKGNIALEITESCLIEPLDEVYEKLDKLRKRGILIYLDDFGTGYSSLNYMKSLPIDVLKIDKSFIDNTISDGVDRRIVKTIISLAHEIGLKVIAEGVEEKEQLTYLNLCGCNTMQGYLFSKPVPEKEILNLI